MIAATYQIADALSLKVGLKMADSEDRCQLGHTGYHSLFWLLSPVSSEAALNSDHSH